MRRYPEEIQAFIAANVKGNSTAELVSLVNVRFGTDFTLVKMQSYKKNHKLVSGLKAGIKPGKPSSTFPAPVKAFIETHYKGVGPTEMTDLVNRTLGTRYRITQIKAYYKNHKLNSGVTGWFVKGQVSLTKGMKTGGGPEYTRFKKGHRPKNSLPVGAWIKSTDGYWCVKIAEPNVWEQIHRRVWEKHHGKIPDNHVVLFGDGDTDNIQIDNLILITRRQLSIMNQRGLISDSAELTRTGVIIADVYGKISERKRNGQR